VHGDGSYLVTGAFGALGRRVAAWLVEQGARHLVLVGRHADSAEAAEAARPLEEAGVRVTRVAGDLGDAGLVSRLVAGVARAGARLRGVFHAAGIVDDGVLEQQDAARVRAVLAAKAGAAWALHEATAALGLDLFVMFSSITSQLPAPGQGSYAAANAVLDALAYHRRARGLPALTVNWGPWTEGMTTRVDARDRQRWAQQGLGTIAPAQGLAALEDLLRRGATQATVLPVDWRKRWAALPAEARAPLFAELAGDAVAEPAPAARAVLLREAGEAPPNRRRGVVGGHLRTRALRVLGLPSAEPIDPRRPLSELGLDSLMAVELRNAIGESVGRALPATLLFKHPTLEALTDFVMGELFAAAPAEVDQTGAPAASETDAALDAVAQLSADEVRRLLADELQSVAPHGDGGEAR
jgi:short-subunit dehydrogenase/acyl carrier protein